jgi:hypothetical protein
MKLEFQLVYVKTLLDTAPSRIVQTKISDE